MSREKSLSIVSLLLLIALLTGCAAPTPEVVEVEKETIVEKAVIQTVEIEKEVIVEKEVIQTVEVVKEVIAKPKGTLVVAQSVDVTSLDPYRGTSEVQMSNVMAPVYEKLFKFDAKGNPSPVLAESLTMIDPQTFELKLRKGVRFHNGEPFDAEDVVYSWNFFKEQNEMRANERTNTKNMEIIDPHTIKLTAIAPDPILTRRFAVSMPIVPNEWGEEHGTEYFLDHANGTGPFTFVDWVKDASVTLEANMDYWGGPPRYGTLVWKVIPEPAARLAALQTGEVDIATRLPASLLRPVEGQGGIRVMTVPANRFYYFELDVRDPDGLFYDKRVRQAVNYGVDVQGIIDSLYAGEGVRARTSVVGPESFGYDDTIPGFTYDPDKAKELLVDAGWTPGPDGILVDASGRKFQGELNCPSGAYLFDVQLCEAGAGEMRKLGMDIFVSVREAGAHWDAWKAGIEQMRDLGLDGMGSYWFDIAPPLRTIVHSESDWGWYEHPDIDEKMELAQSLMDPKERQKLYSEIQRYFLDDPPFLFLFHLNDLYGVSSRVLGFVPYPNQEVHVEDVAVAD